MKLYEISGEIAAILNTEEWTDETFERLESLGMALEQKADNCAAVLSDYDAFAEKCKAEEQRIAAIRRHFENRRDRLMGYLKSCMEAAQREEVVAGTRVFKIKKNPPRVVIDSEEKIPARFWVVIPETKQVDKKAVAAALKAGDIEGAHLEQGTRLDIK